MLCPGADDHDRTGGVAHDSLGNAANKGPREPAAAMAADHDKIGLPFLRSLDDL